MIGEQISLFDDCKDGEYEKLIKGSKLNIKTSQLAMDYGMSAIKFNRLLKAIGFHKRVNNQWIPCSEYLGYGYFIFFVVVIFLVIFLKIIK